MIHVVGNIFLDESELTIGFVRSSGPGGQNVNKVSTAAQLRFNAAASPSLSPEMKDRLLRLAGRRATEVGVIIIDAREHRTQSQNRQAAIDRLLDLLRRAAAKPRPRRKTRPTAASKQRRLTAKRRRSAAKVLRRQAASDE